MKYLLFLSIFIYALFAKTPDAVIKIDKNVDQGESITIVGASSVSPKFKKEVNRLFKSDFSITGHFLVKDNNLTNISYSTLPIALNTKTKLTLLYNFSKTNTNGASLDIKLYEGSPKKIIFSKNYNVSRLEKTPFLIHKAVSEINDLKKYPPVNWMNRYVVISRYTGAKKTEILLADYTFTYQKVIVKNGFNMFPIWADKEQKSLYYSNYAGDVLNLYKLNIYTGKKSLITKSQGMLICSDVSSDGSKLLLTMAPNSQPDIYLFSGGSAKRLTKFSGIDVGGKFADGESSVVFVSNRLGSPNIFKMPLTRGDVSKVVFHGTNNSSVDAHDKELVYSSKEGRKSFNIYLTDTNGMQTRPLTSGGVNQFPRFSQDGNIVMYIKRTSGGNSIGFLNLSANRSELFKMGINRIQSIDW